MSWYGYQTLALDLAAIPLAIVPPVSLGVYVLGGPAVHVAHGRFGAALGSLGLRVGLPIVGLGAALAIADCDSDGDDLCGLAALPGLAVGVLAAVILDASVLSWKSEEVKKAPAYSVAVSMDPRRSEARIGVGARF